MVREKAFYRTILTIALPSAIQGVISMFVVLVDNMMVASLGDTVYAGVAQANSATAFFTATITGLVGGSSVLIAQYWGKNDTARIKRVFAIVSWICMLTGILFAAVISLAPGGVLSLLTSEAAVIDAGLPYFRLVCWSYLPMALSMALVGMLRSVEVVRVTLYTTLLSLASNIALNYALIFGKLGMPALGAQGAALATVIARLLELALVLVYLFRVQQRVAVRPRDFLRGDKELLLDYARFGLPVGVVDAQWAIVGLCKAAIIGRLGERMIAANNIAESLMQMGMIFTSSLAGGACVVIGKTVGAGDYDRTRAYSKTIQLMFLMIGVVMASAVFFLRAPFAGLYGVSEEAKALAVQMIGLAAISLVGTTYHASCFVGINRGAGDSRFVMVVDMICGWLVVLPVSYLAAFVFEVPLPWMFLMLRIDQLFKWMIAFLRLRGNKWIRNVTRGTSGAVSIDGD